MKSPNKSFFFTIGVILLVLIYLLVSESQLEKNGILLNAKTTRWISGAKMNVTIEYEFYYEGKKYTANNAFNKFRGNQNFENRFFPVMYYPKLGGHSQLLIEPSDFERFDLPFPDSLKWVLPYLK